MDKHENLSDLQLVQLSLKDHRNFEYLMERYEPLLLRYMKRIANVGREEAEDLLQDIFIKVYKNLNGFDQKLKFSSWIYRIAHNEIVNQAYKKKVRSATTSLNEGNEHLLKQGDWKEENNAHFGLESRETSERMRAALMELPVKYREVLILKFFEVKSYREISDILKKPEGTIATLINRAKKKFKKIAMRYQLESEILP